MEISQVFTISTIRAAQYLYCGIYACVLALPRNQEARIWAVLTSEKANKYFKHWWEGPNLLVTNYWLHYLFFPFRMFNYFYLLAVKRLCAVCKLSEWSEWFIIQIIARNKMITANFWESDILMQKRGYTTQQMRQTIKKYIFFNKYPNAVSKSTISGITWQTDASWCALPLICKGGIAQIEPYVDTFS